MSARSDVAARCFWALLPWAALAMIWVAADALPQVDCGSDPGMTVGRTAFYVVSGVAIVTLLAGAAHRALQLWRMGYGRPERWLILGPLFLTGVGLGAFGFLGGRGSMVVGLALGLAVMAVLSYLALLIAFVVGRSVQGAGVLVPIALTFVAAFLCLPLAKIILVVNEGGFC